MRNASAILLQAVGGLFGAAGIAGAAYSAHGTSDATLAATAAAILLAHAPTLLALSLAADTRPRGALLPGILLIAGTLLFSGDLLARIFLGDRLFANAAPIGGMILIAGWLTVTITAFIGRRAG